MTASKDTSSSPISVGALTLRNRYVLGAVSSLMEDSSGLITDQMKGFFVRRAAGGAAVVTLGIGSVTPNVKVVKRQLALYDDRVMESLQDLCDQIHEQGALVAVQLHHAGRLASPHYNAGVRPKGPSEGIAGKLESLFGNPAQLEQGDILEILKDYGEATRRAVAAGCDVLEIHAAHGHGLPQQFLSPYTNRRTDQWGGSLQGRLKFSRSLVHEVREAAGQDKAVIYRISADEFVPGGLRLEDTQEISAALETYGVDAISVSAGNYDATRPVAVAPPSMGRQSLAHLSRGIKEVVEVPVMVAGRLLTREDVNSVIDRGDADIGVLVRALIADPDLPSTMDPLAPRPCAGTMWCLRDVRRGAPIECSVNPIVGHEIDYPTVEDPPEPSEDTVLVVGGGPAGMEAARTAALRGLQVTLAEREQTLGGQLTFAAQIDSKGDYLALVKYYESELSRLGVDVRLETTVDEPFATEFAPDYLIAAVGPAWVSVTDAPGFGPLADGPLVIRSPLDVWRANGNLSELELGRHVVVLGSDGVACDVAETLGHAGFFVKIVTPERRIGHDVEAFTRWEQLKVRFPELEIEVHRMSRIESVTEDTVTLRSTADEDGARSITADSVIMPAIKRPGHRLTAGLSAFVGNTSLVGECRAVTENFAGIHQAIHEGFQAGSTVGSSYRV